MKINWTIIFSHNDIIIFYAVVWFIVYVGDETYLKKEQQNLPFCFVTYDVIKCHILAYVHIFRDHLASTLIHSD